MHVHTMILHFDWSDAPTGCIASGCIGTTLQNNIICETLVNVDILTNIAIYRFPRGPFFLLELATVATFAYIDTALSNSTGSLSSSWTDAS